MTPKYRWIPIFHDWHDDFSDLSDEEFGMLITAIMDYYATGEEPAISSPYLRTVFKCMRRRVDNWFDDHLEELEANNWYENEEEVFI